MTTKEQLAQLFVIEKQVQQQLRAVQVAIALKAKQYSAEQGYRVPLRDEALRREINDGNAWRPME